MVDVVAEVASGSAGMRLSGYEEVVDADDEAIEEIITVGSQIRGASITGALSVSVISAETIDSQPRQILYFLGLRMIFSALLARSCNE